MAKTKLKIWLSATSISDEDLGQIIPVLRRKYAIVNSHHVVAKAGNDFNLDNHLNELEECDLFLGIIQPKLLKSSVGIENIYLEEIKKAIELKIPYWFLVHRDVTFTRNLLNDLVKSKDVVAKSKNRYLFDVRTIDIYKEILKQSIGHSNANNHNLWEFYRLDGLIQHFEQSIFNSTHKKDTKLMLASTVYGFEDQLSKIIHDIAERDFDVLSSFHGSIKVNPKLSNLNNCIQAVDEANWFLGIVRPYYGTGNINETNITFEEIKTAIKLNKPRWFYIHRDVVFAEKILISIIVNKPDKSKTEIPNELLPNHYVDKEAIDLYNFVIKNDENQLELRNGNWAQEFFVFSEALIYIRSQFLDFNFVKNLLKMKNNGR
ncbi:MAG: DUF4062 domain-containing protein [Crocinitomicaceae bacterium]|nr:DUF4062 domain-containing protein [Crocinitomicaceae bacterium]